MFLIFEAENLPYSSPSFSVIFSLLSLDFRSDHATLGSGNAVMVLKMVRGSPATPSIVPESEEDRQDELSELRPNRCSYGPEARCQIQLRLNASTMEIQGSDSIGD